MGQHLSHTAHSGPVDLAWSDPTDKTHKDNVKHRQIHYLAHIHECSSVNLKRKVMLWREGEQNKFRHKISLSRQRWKLIKKKSKKEDSKDQWCSVGRQKGNQYLIFILFRRTVMNIQERAKSWEFPFTRWDTEHAAVSKSSMKPHIHTHTHTEADTTLMLPKDTHSWILFRYLSLSHTHTLVSTNMASKLAISALFPLK